MLVHHTHGYWFDHFECRAPHARNSVMLVVFRWDRLAVLTTYEGSVYILNGDIGHVTRSHVNIPTVSRKEVIGPSAYKRKVSVFM